MFLSEVVGVCLAEGWVRLVAVLQERTATATLRCAKLNLEFV
jgi:hypothetical protein